MSRMRDADFRLLVQAVQDYAIFMLDAEGHILSWNEGARRIKGYEPDEIVGKHFSVFYPPEDVASHKPAYELRAAASDGVFEDIGWRVRKDGSMFWANVVLTALRDDAGRLVGYSKVTRDITERRQAEEALKASEERYRALVDSVKDYAIFMLDASGRVRTWNPGAQRIKGYAPSEIIGEHFSRFYTPEDVAEGRPGRLLAKAAQDGRVEDEGWRVRKDGSRFWADVVITSIVGRDGKLAGFSKVTRDLSERRDLYAEQAALRRAAREVTEANRELEAFSYTVAHDLRAPIRAIQTLAQYLERDHGTELPPTGRELVESIQRSARKMGELVEDLLSFSRSAKGELRLEKVDIAKLAQHIHANTLRRREPDRVGTLDVDDDISLWGDPGLLRIAMENLLSNAWKFTRRRDRYHIRVGKRETARTITVYVEDNGVGFPPERAGELFQPFRRLHSVEAFEGTGIGLATVRRIVERHGGSVHAESTPGVRTTFSFTLPKQEAAPHGSATR